MIYKNLTEQDKQLGYLKSARIEPTVTSFTVGELKSFIANIEDSAQVLFQGKHSDMWIISSADKCDAKVYYGGEYAEDGYDTLLILSC